MMHPTHDLAQPHTRAVKYKPGQLVLVSTPDVSQSMLATVQRVTSKIITLQPPPDDTAQPMEWKALHCRRMGGKAVNTAQQGHVLLGLAELRVEPLGDTEFKHMQDVLLRVAVNVAGFPLDRFLARIKRSHKLAPAQDRRAYQDGLHRLVAVESLAQALLPFQDAALELAATPDPDVIPEPTQDSTSIVVL